MAPIEGYDPDEGPGEYEPMDPSTPPISHNGKPEHVQFQEGDYGLPPHFMARAQVAGLLRRKSPMFKKEGRNGTMTEFLTVTLDTGPVHARTRDPRKKKLRNLIVCWFSDAKARHIDKVLRDVDAQLYSQPWILVNGIIETRFVWVDKGNLLLGMKPTGEMQIRATSFLLPPVPKMNQVKDKFRGDDFPDAPEICV